VTFHAVTQDGTINPRVAEQPSQSGPSYNAAHLEQSASEVIDMKRYFVLALLLAAASAVSLGAQSKPATAAGDDEIVKADRTLVMAFEKGDHAALNKLLDPDFSWIDTDGIMWAREDVLRAGLKPLVPSGPDVTITEHKYGKVVWIQNNQGNKYAAHFWVQRPAGWRLLHTNEIATRPAVPGENVRPDFTIPCINPCKELPYKPLSPSEKAALENWQDQESGTGHHDMHMGDNTVVISSTTQTPRKSATATGPTPVRPPAADRPFISTTPALYARSWDFGDSVVMIMLQPTWGGKAYWSSRVFANHGNGFWKMEESYHNTIQASPRMTAVAPPKDTSSR